jgi:hypothetical protein
VEGIKIEARCPYKGCDHIDDVYWDPNNRSNWEHECKGCGDCYEIDIAYSMTIECKKIGED